MRARSVRESVVAALLLVLLAALSAPRAAPAGEPRTHFDIFGEETGCAAPSLCGDFGNNLASAGDVNGDQVLDLVISGPTVSAQNPSVGRVYLFYGPFDGGDMLAEEADVTFTGLEFGDLVGTPVSGDLNDDGLSDIVIGSRGPDIGGILNGQVWVFYAPLEGDLLMSDADATITGTEFSELGWSVTVGDFNDDGFDDVLAGAPHGGNNSAHLFYGPVLGELSSLDADAIVSGVQGAGEVGASVAAVDLNDDGIDDVVVGAPSTDSGGLSVGGVFVFFSPISGQLPSTDADITILGEELADDFGSWMASGGDVDNDGSEDLLVGAWQLFAAAPGKAYVFYGPIAPGTHLAADAGAILTGESQGDLFGILDGAGDVNGDGFDDVLVGAQLAGPERHGRAYVFHGPLAGAIPASAADTIFDAPGFDPDQGLDFLGRGVGAARDLDGNGLDDLLLGAPGSEGPGFARVVLSGNLIFADGFESGDVSAWSASVP